MTDKVCDNCLWWNPSSMRCHHPAGNFSFAYAYMTCSGWKGWNAYARKKECDRMFHETRRKAMSDEFTKAALEVVRLKRVHDGNIYRKGQGDICMLDMETNKALDALVEAMPDPRERFLKAADMVGRHVLGWNGPTSPGSKGALNMAELTLEQHHEFVDALNAYRDSRPYQPMEELAKTAIDPTLPDPRDELCEAADAFVDERVDKYGSAAPIGEFLRLKRAAEAYKQSRTP